MVHVLRPDPQIADLEITFDQLVIADLGAHLIEPHREIDILHLPSQSVVQGLPKPFGSVDVPFVSRREKGIKEGDALNVIPMSMTD
jgi:hypothetical protein